MYVNISRCTVAHTLMWEYLAGMTFILVPIEVRLEHLGLKRQTETIHSHASRLDQTSTSMYDKP